jgi:glucosamine-6-phosphate deaminase
MVSNMPMQPAPLVLDDARHVGLLAAELVANRLRSRSGVRVALPTGRTPEGMYAALRDLAGRGALPAAEATAFQLDEYVGVGPSDPRSFASTLGREAGGLGFGALHRLDGSADPATECARHQALLDEAPLDLAVLGLGRDGHVAFDEPGTPPEAPMREVRLTAATRDDASETFGGLDHVPERAITTGLRTLLDARALLLLVTGEAKADVLRAAFEGPLSTEVPASLLRGHPRLTVICDRAAAARLTPHPGWDSDRALVVLGHRAPGSAEHVISEESESRATRAAILARHAPVRTAVLTGWSRTGGLSEAEQMLTWWSEPDTPALLEVAGRRTAENASCSLPLLAATGVIRRVTVVTSWWHLRARWFFAPYREHGIAVDYAPVFHRGSSLGGLLGEARQVPAMARERHEAFAAVTLP